MKKVRYEEPKMPESLRILMDLDAEDTLGRGTKKRGPKKYASKKTKSKTKSKKIDAKKPRPTKQVGPRKEVPKKNDKLTKKTKVAIKSETKHAKKAPTSQYKPDTKRNSTNNINGNKGKLKTPSRGLDDNKKTRIKREKSSKTFNFSNLMFVVIHGISVFFNFLLHGGEKKLSVSQEKKKQLDKKFNQVFSLVFMGLMVLLLVMNILHKDLPKSEAENRTLEQRPALSISDIVSGKYSSKFSDYVSDQFPMRSGFIKAKSRFDLLTGKDKINGVYIGKDGYLMEGFKMASDEVTQTKIDAINKFAQNNSKLNVSVLLSPNKVEIYKNYLPKFAPEDSQTEYMKVLKSKLNSKVKLVDVISTFNRLKNNEQLYFKTDHHWTVEGTYAAYEDYCKAMNLQPANRNSFTNSLASNDFYGSLYYKNAAGIGKPDQLYLSLQQDNNPVLVKYFDTKKKVASLYDVSKLSTKDPYQVFTGGNHTQIRIRTNIDTERKLLVIKDSYANAMLPFLVNNFSEINVVDMRYFTGSIKDLMNNAEVTDVLILGNINTFNTDASILSLNE